MSAAPSKFVRSIFAKEGECGCQKAYPFGLVHCVREPGHVGWCVTASGNYYWHTPKVEEGMTNNEALSCWVKALQADNSGLPVISVSESGERIEIDLYNDNPSKLVDGTWSEAVVTPRRQDD